MIHLAAVLALQLVAPVQQQLRAPAPQRFANVLVVDVAGGGAYSSIQSAITAARPGDTLLVKSGQYPGFVLADKGLSIVGDAGATVVCNTISRVSGVPLGERVLLQHMALTSPLRGLEVVNSMGAVRIEDCMLAAGADSRQAGLYATDSLDVLVRASTLWGGSTPASFPVQYGGPGGTGIDSWIAAYGSTFLGGEGGDGDSQFGGFGGSGWTQTRGELRVELGVFQGGSGGDSWDCMYGTGGDGGPGLRIDPPYTTPSVRATQSTFTGGMYGLHACGYAGNPGPAVSAGAGALVTTPGPARTLAVPALVRDATTVTFTMSGVVGENVFLLVSPRDDRATSATYTGVLHVGAPYLLRVELGAIPAPGVITYAWTIPDEFVPHGLSLTLTAQALHAAPAGALTLSNPVTMVVLDHVW